jgi:CHAT domain-containing protein
LTQPELALTAPQVAGDGIALLTTENILAFKLNADWVILSACNTGAGVAFMKCASLPRMIFTLPHCLRHKN